jgi:hypothetical protein
VRYIAKDEKTMIEFGDMLVKAMEIALDEAVRQYDGVVEILPATEVMDRDEV